MSKNEKAKTKSAKAIALAKSTATSTNNVLPRTLNQMGCRRLAVSVIKSALTCTPKDTHFLESDWYDFWAGLAYGVGYEHYTGKEVFERSERLDAVRVGRPKGTPPNNKLVKKSVAL